jgi:hypothetical protein
MNGPVTTYNNPQAKAFAWSYSKLKNYETCPKRHFHYDIAKDVQEPESQQLKDGNFKHDALAKRLGGKKIPLPAQVIELEKWAARVEATPGTLLVEQKYAIKRDFSSCSWFDKQAWYRGIADVVKLNGPVGLLIDWKDGKIVEDSVQLFLMAQCAFAHLPALQRIRTEFVWLREDATTRQDFKREEMAGHWAGLLPRVAVLEQANQTMTYPAKPGRLCKRWCAVTACPHHGE